MSVKLMIAITLTVTCVVVDARTLRKSSPSDDVTGSDAASRDAIVKRSARDGRRTYSAPVAFSVPVMARRGGPRPVADDALGLLNDAERSRLASLLADAALLDHLRRRRRPSEHRRREPAWAAAYGQLDDEDLMRSVAGVYDSEDGLLAEAGIPAKRIDGHLRSPRELHPVYLGLGQNAASAALNTYASLLADEKRRESLVQQQQGSENPVRFIGRR